MWYAAMILSGDYALDKDGYIEIALKRAGGAADRESEEYNLAQLDAAIAEVDNAHA
jgi:hypothetical protein